MLRAWLMLVAKFVNSSLRYGNDVAWTRAEIWESPPDGFSVSLPGTGLSTKLPFTVLGAFCYSDASDLDSPNTEGSQQNILFIPHKYHPKHPYPTVLGFHSICKVTN